MIKILRRYSILTRMIAQGLLILGGVGALYAINLLASWSIEEDQATAIRFSAGRAAALTIEVMGLELREHEKDFLLEKKVEHRDAYLEAYGRAQRGIADLMAAGLGPQFDAITRDLSAGLEAHKSQFDRVSANMSRAGLTADEGLEGQLRTSVHEIEDVLKANNDKDLTILMLQMRRHEKDFIARLQTKYIDRIGLRREEFLERLPSTPFASDTKVAILKLLENYVDSFNAFAAIRLELIEEVRALSSIYEDLAPNYGRLTALAEEGYRAASANRKASQEAARVGNNLVSVLVLLVVGSGTALIVTSTARPVRELSTAVKCISKGDYTTEVPGVEHADEIGQVSAAVLELRNSALQRLELEQQAAEFKARQEQAKLRQAEEAKREMEAKHAREAAEMREREERARLREELIASFEEQVSMSLVRLGEASADMQESAQDMVSVAEKTGHRVEEVTMAAGEMNQVASTNSASISQFSSSIAEVNQQVRQAHDLCAHTSELANDGMRVIEDMRTSASQVDSVISLINDIADQTNLLALNATIEAARAGEAGRGFAVVASEVKTLSKQTASATEQVANEVAAMQARVDETVATMDEINKQIDALNASMNMIASASEQQDASTLEISRGIEVTATGAEQVTNVVSDVREDAIGTSELSEKVRHAADDLALLGSHMSESVTNFLCRVRDLATSTPTEIDKAA